MGCGAADAVRWTVGVLAAAGAIGGCGGLSAPAPTSPPATTTTGAETTRAETMRAETTRAEVARAETTHEYASAPAPDQGTSHPSITPSEAVRAFAVEYINWDADTVAAHMRLLAAASVGQARSAMALAAASTARDYELRRGGISNRGSVEAIAPLAGGGLRFVVVTREQTSATNTAAYQGLRAAWHVTVATVTRVGPGEFALSGWQPES
jgi:hypothetical protein